VNNIII
jgi:hypothetical protein